MRIKQNYLKVSTLLLITLFFLNPILQSQTNNNMETATFGSGCFWCTEAIFDMVEGVYDVFPGYAGGTEKNPTYELVCSGTTKYAEVIQVNFDPNIVSFDELLEIFWNTHNPTTLNKQGADIGPQYRSVIFYHNDFQKERAEYFKNELNDSEIWTNPIVTEISPITNFYKAEKYHLDYYKNNPANSYCSFVITPKIEKFEKVFQKKLKK